MIKLKKINYPKFEEAQTRGDGTPIAKNAFYILSKTYKKIDGGWEPEFMVRGTHSNEAIMLYPVTSIGYAKAKKLFEALTLEAVNEIVEVVDEA